MVGGGRLRGGYGRARPLGRGLPDTQGSGRCFGNVDKGLTAQNRPRNRSDSTSRVRRRRIGRKSSVRLSPLHPLLSRRSRRLPDISDCPPRRRSLAETGTTIHCSAEGGSTVHCLRGRVENGHWLARRSKIRLRRAAGRGRACTRFRRPGMTEPSRKRGLARPQAAGRGRACTRFRRGGRLNQTKFIRRH